LRIAEKPGVLSGGQDATLYGSQDGRRYAGHKSKMRSARGGISGSTLL